MKLTLIALGALILTGCASNDYRLYAEMQVKIAQAQAQAEATKEAARYAALAEIAKTGDTTARVAAAMSIHQGTGSTQQTSPKINVAPPKSWADTALQWTGVLLPSVTQLYGISANRQIAITQSNNAAATAASTNQAFTNIANGGFTSNTTIANGIRPNVTISGNSGSSINASNTGTSSTGNATWQPLKGTGVIGDGTYTDSRDQSNKPVTTTTTTTTTTDSRDQSTNSTTTSNSTSTSATPSEPTTPTTP